MPPLVKIRSERDRMSAIERRIADFILQNAHLLRDYSSQQLADALNISQSSVVKFSQKLGFKGYPDLKYSVGEAVARHGNGEQVRALVDAAGDPHEAMADDLWHGKTRAEEETRLINDRDRLVATAHALGNAGKVFCIGTGTDSVLARHFAMRLSLLGIVTLHHAEAAMLAASLATVMPGDVLVVFSEQGTQPTLLQISRQFRELHGRMLSVTRNTANPLRTHADYSLAVSAHDERQHVEPLLYESAVQHLLDLVFVLLCEDNVSRRTRLAEGLARLHRIE
jgi:DNA-binding MurR/RpiR family transcriptional regulator